MIGYDEDFREELTALEAKSRLRKLPEDFAALRPGLIDMSSNDYLGLAAEGESLAEEFLSVSKCRDFTSCASRLLSHRQKEHLLLENLLSSLYGKEALIFNSGYHANVGVIQALALPGTIFVADRLAHASMIDGLILSHSPFERFRHNEISHLKRILLKHREAARIVVITEAIFSMDGDSAPLRELTALKEEFPNMLLYLDEAHSVGVCGPQGLGRAEEENLLDNIDIIIGTFGKALASSGAFVATSPAVKEWLINSARSLIFSTALPPVNVAYTRFILEKVVGMNERRQRLKCLSAKFREELSRLTGAHTPSVSQIVPWITGDSALALKISADLREAGFDALPIRRPTVPPGGERIRFSLSASLSEEDISRLLYHINSLSAHYADRMA